MRPSHFLACLALGLLGRLGTGSQGTPDPAASARELGLELAPQALADLLASSPKPELPPSPGNRWADDLAAARLGRRLFNDPGLSYASSVNCASCHPARRAFTNGVMDLRGPEALRRRSPTLIDVAYLPWFGWAGNNDSLWAQALGPLEDVTEQDGSRTGFVHHLASTPDLKAEFEAVFGPLPDVEDLERFPPNAKPVPYRVNHRHNRAWQGMTPEDREAVTRVLTQIGKAIEAFERRLISGPAPFDDFVAALEAGDLQAAARYGEPERRGLELFFGRANCQRCHAGPLFTDGEFHDTRVPVLEPKKPDPARKLGLTKLAASPFTTWGPYADVPRPQPQLPDPESQAGRWRTAPLRVLKRPGGYMHEGQFPSLEAALRYYSELEGARPLAPGEVSELEPLHLSAAEIADLAAFLRSLQGPPPAAEWQ